jgi:D-xylose 1-dehydrogenase (NADP+, D-xylono-1,5-lactone-forming)
MAETMKTLGWGLLGTARINRALIPPLRASKRNRLLAVASRRPETAAAYAREWGIERVHGSYEALLADPEVDVVYIPLPNGLHAEWVIRAARAGKHVLCEKPLAVTVEEVDAIAGAAREAQVTVAEAFMYRHHPQTAQVREVVTSGALGRVRLVRGSFSFVLTRPQDARRDPALGGGSLWDVGCYPLSFARSALAQEPLEVMGVQHEGPTGVDLTFAAQLRFPDDVLVQFDCSFEAPFRTVMEVVGETASLVVTQPFKPGAGAQLLLNHGDKTETIAVPEADLYIGEVEDLADAVLLGKPPRVSLADSRGNVAAIVALLRSARENRPIRLG